ncbi:MAG TPA: hypothetical protein VMW19_21740 [Myxococcota bacterium]|nr:hypothetical protein [Myxococcota bacterium]
MRDLPALGGLLVAGVVPNLAYLALGAWIVRALGLRASGCERIAQAYVVGTGAASLAILLLRALDVPIPLLACAALAAAGLPALRTQDRVAPSGPDAPRWRRAVDVATLVVAVLTFLAALGPETFWDGFEYHLPIVQAWTQGPLRALPGWLDAETRAGVDLLYVPAVAARQPDAAAAVTACFAAALAALVRAEAGRRASPGAGSLAAFFTLVVPLTLANAASTYVDLGVGAYGFLALLAADRWSRDGEPRQLLLSALCLGFAANAKLHAAALVPAAALIAWCGGRTPGARLSLRAAALLAAVTTPWLVKEALTAGNPFFPLFGGWLGTGPFDPRHLALRQLRLGTDYPLPRTTPSGLGAYLLSLTFGRNVHSGGLVGPLPLALGVLAIRRPTRDDVVLSASIGALWLLQALFMPALRFAMPILPFFAIAAAVGGTRLARSGPAARAALAGVLLVLAGVHGLRLADAYLPRIAALHDPHAYEARVFPDQDHLRRLVALGRGVVAIPGGAAAWMDRPVYLLDWERNGELFLDPVHDAHTSPDDALALLRRRGVGSLVLDVAPGDERTGHASVDAWIRNGVARIRDGAPRLPARHGREWLLLDLADLIDRPETHR